MGTQKQKFYIKFEEDKRLDLRLDFIVSHFYGEPLQGKAIS